MFFLHVFQSLFVDVPFGLQLGNPLHLANVEVAGIFQVLDHYLVELIFDLYLRLLVVEEFLLKQFCSGVESFFHCLRTIQRLDGLH